MTTKVYLRDVEKGTPLYVAQQLWQGAKRLEMRLQKSVVTVTRKGDNVSLADGKDKAATIYNWNDKDDRRKLLHRIWRWQKRSKWKVVK